METKADVLLLQEVSVADSDFSTPQEAADDVSSDLFSGAYSVVGFKMSQIKSTWFGNMVLVSRKLFGDYDFLNLQSCDFYSGSKYFNTGRPLCAVMMVPKATPMAPAMLLCSAHSEHRQTWDNSSTQKLLRRIIQLSMDAFEKQTPGAIFDQMGMLFGGDLNTTRSNPCSWQSSIRFSVQGQTFTIYKTSSKRLKQNTLTIDGLERLPVPRDWIFSTCSDDSGGKPDTIMINSLTGSDHYAVLVATKSSMSDFTQAHVSFFNRIKE